MKKALFSMMSYKMPDQDVLPLHCSATEGQKARDVSLIFGRASSGKTTLAHDDKRLLIGDDEHCWTYSIFIQ